VSASSVKRAGSRSGWVNRNVDQNRQHVLGTCGDVLRRAGGVLLSLVLCEGPIHLHPGNTVYPEQARDSLFCACRRRPLVGVPEAAGDPRALALQLGIERLDFLAYVGRSR
jgi:hypothetical protein